MRNEPKSSKSSSASNPKQNQQILFIVLLILVALLTFELVRGRMASRKKSKEKEPATAITDTTKKAVEKKQTTEDSIAKLYAPAVFRQEQMKQTRVKDAYKTKGDTVQKLYKKAGLDPNTVNIYIRAFKKEQVVEVWGKDKEKSEFVLLRTYKFCKMAGKLGPKLQAGDNQIPEGFYKIDRYNPQSRFHLSLGLNYPNKVDKKIGDTTNLGNDIFIHGGCQTIGCIPITDEKIKELYVMAIDARAAGQKTIAVSIFPARMTDENFRSLRVQFQDEPKTLKFWASLRKGYQFFEDCKRLPDIILSNNGEYVCKSACGGD
jgi:murein L,D-transpeptidase YafK